jgi:hypothetical protein
VLLAKIYLLLKNNNITVSDLIVDLVEYYSLLTPHILMGSLSFDNFLMNYNVSYMNNPSGNSSSGITGSLSGSPENPPGVSVPPYQHPDRVYSHLHPNRIPTFLLPNRPVPEEEWLTKVVVPPYKFCHELTQEKILGAADMKNYALTCP